jgi:hypothetical protein
LVDVTDRAEATEENAAEKESNDEKSFMMGDEE